MVIQRFSNLEFERWDELEDAINQLIDRGTYRSLVQVHSRGRHLMHGSRAGEVGYKRFLPWHRAYLIVFERELCSINSALSIPYWDWNADRGELTGFFNLLGLSAGRNLGTKRLEPTQQNRAPWFTTEAEVRGLLSSSDGYYQFTQDLEIGPHNHGHMWIGGDMGNPMIAPRDPAFWFHHAQIDRIWSLWQRNHPNEIAELSGENARLDPWDADFDINSINNIANLDGDSYEYVEPANSRRIIS